jgi:hypothetical protein
MNKLMNTIKGKYGMSGYVARYKVLTAANMKMTSGMLRHEVCLKSIDVSEVHPDEGSKYI